MAVREQKTRIPKSDDVNTFEGYAMTKEEVEAYLKKQEELRGSYYLKLLAAE